MNQNSLHEDELLNGLRRECAQSFQAIYDKYWLKLYQVAYRKIGEKEVAEELIQEIFLNLWVKRETIIITTSLEAYLFTAVKYAVINYYHAQLVRQKYKSAAEPVVTATNSTEEAIFSAEITNTLEKALAVLSAKTRRVFKKSRFQHLSNKEIAQELQLSDKAVEFHITKTLKHLRIFLKDFVLPLITLSIPLQ